MQNLRPFATLKDLLNEGSRSENFLWSLLSCACSVCRGDKTCLPYQYALIAFTLGAVRCTAAFSSRLFHSIGHTAETQQAYIFYCINVEILNYQIYFCHGVSSDPDHLIQEAERALAMNPLPVIYVMTKKNVNNDLGYLILKRD